MRSSDPFKAGWIKAARIWCDRVPHLSWYCLLQAVADPENTPPFQEYEHLLPKE